MIGKSYQYAATQLAQMEADKQIAALLAQLEEYHDEVINPRVIQMVMTQLTLKVEIKMWGNDAVITARNEATTLEELIQTSEVE
jgi:hypothetical protein